MDPAETVQAFREIKARKLMIAHWGTFQLGDEPVNFPPRDLENALKKVDLSTQWVHLDHGHSYTF
jgi:L-ascorbate metabolism protein UlaG (beta-lactamase superfamily)